MAKRNVTWIRTADLQYVGILEYWVKHNKSNTYSKKLLKLVSKRPKEIARNPLIFKSTNFKEIRVASVVIKTATRIVPKSLILTIKN